MAGELVQARSILAIGQRLEIFFENSEEGTQGYTSRIEDITGDELVVAMPVDERRVPVIPSVRTCMCSRPGTGATTDFSAFITVTATMKESFPFCTSLFPKSRSASRNEAFSAFG